jgi:hypothetical protein
MLRMAFIHYLKQIAIIFIFRYTTEPNTKLRLDKERSLNILSWFCKYIKFK